MKLIIPADVEAKMHAYVSSVKTEIAGMGKAKISDGGNIMLLDVAIYDQEVTGGTADLSTTALAKFQTELVMKGESPKDWIVWWHSHADMAAFFSKRDTDTIDQSDEFPHLVSLVVNHRRERKARVDTYHPFRFTKDNLDIIVGTKTEEIPPEIMAEVEQKVHTRTYAPVVPYQSNMGFGQYHTPWGKTLPVESDDDYDAYRDGHSKIIDTSRPELLDIDEIEAIIEATKDQIKTYENTGNGDCDECQELKDDLANWELELIVHHNTDLMADRIGTKQ